MSAATSPVCDDCGGFPVRTGAEVAALVEMHRPPCVCPATEGAWTDWMLRKLARERQRRKALFVQARMRQTASNIRSPFVTAER